MTKKEEEKRRAGKTFLPEGAFLGGGGKTSHERGKKTGVKKQDNSLSRSKREDRISPTYKKK